MKAALLGARARPAALCAPARVQPTAPAHGALLVQNAHKKGSAAVKNGRDSNSKSRGVKVYGGQPVKAGGIIVRQVGNSVRTQAQLLVCVPPLRLLSWGARQTVKGRAALLQPQPQEPTCSAVHASTLLHCQHPAALPQRMQPRVLKRNVAARLGYYM